MNKTEAAGRALAVLDRDGWVQFGTEIFAQGRVCAGMAIQRAAQEDGLLGPDRRPLGVYYELLMTLNMNVQGRGWFGIAVWNDDPGTSLEDVKLEIKRAGAA